MAFIIWCLLSGHVDFIVLILLIFAALLTCVLCRFFLLMIIKSANATYVFQALVSYSNF